MKAKRTKVTAPTVEVSESDRGLLAQAYKNGLIAAWRHDLERGYQLTFGDRQEEYVEIKNLSTHLEKLRKKAS